MAMATQDLQHLFHQARIKLPGVSDTGMKNELFEVLHEFFNDSSCWLENITVPVVAGITQYAVVPAEDGMIARLVGVTDSNLFHQPALMPVVGEITLQNAPNTNANFIVSVAKIPAQPTTKDNIPVAPDWVLPLYTRTILAGLVGNMMMHPNKAYSDSTLGTFNLRRFRDGIAMARTAALRRNSFGTQSWLYPQQFRTRGQRGGVSIGPNIGF